MKRIVTVLVLFSLAIAAGCSDDPGSASNPTSTPTTGTGSTQTASTISSATGLVGSWHRAQSCAEMLAAFEAAGLAESHIGWLQGNFYGGEPGPTGSDPCAGANGPLEHDHFFTDDGMFGSHDENGEEVDHGDYELVDDDTVSFPSHASEFGYDGELVVDFSIEGDVATFVVVSPETCVDQCADAHAWALSAFASGPWASGEVPQ